ncbi:recombinase family protein [Streptomyces sp. NRRL F-5053]|uniref:recombinase family protein n=1 Tax=Streptomyces sp. NRRL F-5053 TaxID=1463854 RepID=UPI00099D32CF|nr:recombinase family protein [Streptomyces sp. NRRL F-5053]
MSDTFDPRGLCDLYLRRSTLQDDKTTLKAHERDLRERAKREGLKVRKVWKEELSAFKSGVVREEFDKAVAAVIAGEVRHLLVWKLDRLSRKGMGQVGQVLDEFDTEGARLVAHMDGLDSSIPQHRGLFAWLAEQARSESYNTSIRTRSTKREKKATGSWPGGQPPYGLRVRKGKVEHHPREYEFSRAIAEMLLAGIPATTIAEKLNERGWKTRRGNKWRSSSITQLTHSPAWAGLMPSYEQYKDRNGRERWRATGEPFFGEDGKTVSIGKGVITVGERARILANLRSRTSEAMAAGRRGKPSAQSLLSGFLKCGRCQGPMCKGGRSYRCYRRVNLGKTACQGMSVLVKDIDRVIEIAFVNKVKQLSWNGKVFRELASRWQAYEDPEAESQRLELTAARDEAKARLHSLENAYYIQGHFKGTEGEERYTQLRTGICDQIQEIQAGLDKIVSLSEFLSSRDPIELREAWKTGDLEKSRALLGIALTSVTLLPPKGTGPRSLFALFARCCFHWAGEKAQPLRIDGTRMANTVWPTEYVSWAEAS